MKIHKVKSRENKGYQLYQMVDDCTDYWYMLNNADYPRLSKLSYCNEYGNLYN